MKLILLCSIIAAVLLEQQVSAQVPGPGTLFGSGRLINRFIRTTTVAPGPSTDSSDPFSLSFDFNSLIPKDIKDLINGNPNGAINLGSGIANSIGLTQSSLPNVATLISGNGTNVDQLIKELNQQRINLQNASISQLNKVYNNIQNVNNTIAQSIEKLGINAAAHFNKLRNSVSSILPCIGEAYSSLGNASRAAATEGINCLMSKVKEADDLRRNATNDIMNALNNTIDVYKQIQQCKDVGGTFLISNFTRQASCLMQAALNIRGETLLLPISLSQRVAQATFLINSLQGHLINCATSVLRVFSIEAINSARQVLLNCANVVERPLFSNFTTTP